MNVHLKFFLPSLPGAIGKTELDIDFDGKTVNDLIEHLVNVYGNEARKALYDDQDNLDPMIQILRNGEEWITHDQLGTPLDDGDELIFMLIMAGG
ncbi:MAG: MoaD family protein [Anaerolineales bacterium]|nr:MoaD family protein [Anaerolineales bacterium]